MVDVLNDLPGSPPMREVHIWIGHYTDGSEGMLAADFPMIDGLTTRHMPLMSSQRNGAERLKPFAEKIQRLSQRGRSKITRLELRTFHAVGDQ